MLKAPQVIFALIFALGTQQAFAQTDNASGTIIEETSSDGTVSIHIESNLPKAESPLVINIRFSDVMTGSSLSNVNYDIIAMQNGEIVLSQMGLHTANGLAQHVTQPLTADNHVEVMIILQGMGTDSPYSGPQGETIEIIVVPEFGAVASIVLLLSVIATIIIQKTVRTA
ncbi:PEFG-CTERM sorting domain-containing protein [Candidatus Nitrosotenuis cloacae]|uniref:PEFG-CTERM sorting domain-containing protein n=1 Tax=Candidatus Nitrosotenuis cloacae TaxID=1603555 RepID=UPI00227FE2F2|nr:PEFG-CTERM sorting domain-containing protein [Candidatus Nitrosotenuis cloacae]